MLREPLFAGAVGGVLSEVTKPRRSESLTDESIGSFVTRRFGSSVADNILSAVMHGIYGGDIYKLSARTIIPAIWHTESRHTSVTRGILDALLGGMTVANDEDLDAIKDFRSSLLDEEKDFVEKCRNSSVFTFKRGLGELGDRLEERLVERKNVLIWKDTEVNDLKLQFRTEGSRVSKLNSPYQYRCGVENSIMAEAA